MNYSSRSEVISLVAVFFSSLHHNSNVEEAFHQLCLADTLYHYVLPTASRQMQQLFVHHRGHSQGVSVKTVVFSQSVWCCHASLHCNFCRASAWIPHNLYPHPEGWKCGTSAQNHVCLSMPLHLFLSVPCIRVLPNSITFKHARQLMTFCQIEPFHAHATRCSSNLIMD